MSVIKMQRLTEQTAAAPMPGPLCEADKNPYLCSILHVAAVTTRGEGVLVNFNKAFIAVVEN